MDDVQMYEGSDGPGPSNEAHLHAQEQPAENEGGGQQGQVVASLYPPIPSVYARFTRQNIHRYRVLRDRLDDAMRKEWNDFEPSERIKRQELLLEEAEAALTAERGGTLDVDSQGKTENEQPSLLPAPDWDVMLEMDGPNVDWIEEDGYYSCFGDRWPVSMIQLFLSWAPSSPQPLPLELIVGTDRRATAQSSRHGRETDV